MCNLFHNHFYAKTNIQVLADDGLSTSDIECALLWKLARTHGWSTKIPVRDLVSDANILDEKRGREVARNQLADMSFIGYYQGRDVIWLNGPPSDAVCYHLRDECGYTEIQIEATFDSYFDGF